MKIDFTCTAMPVPELMERCFKSLKRNLIGIDLKKCNICVSLDNFPDVSRRLLHAQFGKIYELLYKYFGDNAIGFCEDFSNSVRNCFLSVRTDIIFHFEYDWELTKPINVDEIIQKFSQSPNLYQVPLRAYSYDYPALCLSPSFLHKRFYKPFARNMNINRNPEAEMHTGKIGIFLPNRNSCKQAGVKVTDYIQAYPEENNDIVLKDIGREWLGNSPYMKPQDLPKTDPRYKKKSEFIKWIKRNENEDCLEWLAKTI